MLTLLDCKDNRIRKFEFKAKTELMCGSQEAVRTIAIWDSPQNSFLEIYA